jgi:ribonuclease J
MEGTHIREDSDGTEGGPTEKDVEEACVRTFKGTNGIVLAMFSPQNIDRLVSIYRACIRSGRDLVIDLYSAAILEATGRETIPHADWDRVRVYLPRSQRSRVIQEKAFHRTDAVRDHRIYPEELAERRTKLVMLFRISMARELEKADCLEGAGIVWSMWPGYLQGASGVALDRFREANAISMDIHHASGHAHISDLQRMVTALAPKRLVPMHSSASHRFGEFFPGVELRADGVWWEV